MVPLLYDERDETPGCPFCSKLNLSSQLYYSIRRNAEKTCRVCCVFGHPNKQFLTPDGHAPFRTCDQGLSPEKIGSLSRFKLEPGEVHLFEGLRDVRILHEAIPDNDAVNSVSFGN